MKNRRNVQRTPSGQVPAIPFRVPTLDRQLKIVSDIDEQLAAYQRVQVTADQADATLRAIVGGPRGSEPQLGPLLRGCRLCR
jgi:hypothetical protein